MQVLDGGGPRTHETGKTVFVAKHAKEDLVVTLQMLDALTSEKLAFIDHEESPGKSKSFSEQGKDILHFEERMGPFLFNIFPHVLAFVEEDTKKSEASAQGNAPVENSHLAAFLELLLNLIKFNPAYLDPEVVVGLIGYLSVICSVRKTWRNTVDLCMKVGQAQTSLSRGIK